MLVRTDSQEAAMYYEPLPRETDHSTRKRLTRRRATPSERESNDLRLAALDRTIYPSDALNDPALAMLMTEDFCWQAALADWRARRPPRWHRGEHRVWRAEKTLLDEKRARIRDLAGQLRLVS